MVRKAKGMLGPGRMDEGKKTGMFGLSMERLTAGEGYFSATKPLLSWQYKQSKARLLGVYSELLRF